MRVTPALIAVGLAVVIVIGLLIDSPWSSDDGEHTKASLISDVSRTMEDSDAPPALTKCLTGGLEEQLSDAEVSRAYEQAPPGGGEGGTPVAEFPPVLRARVARVGLLCLGKIVRSGDLTRKQIDELMLRMSR
jgi:hypothetical protein